MQIQYFVYHYSDVYQALKMLCRRALRRDAYPIGKCTLLDNVILSIDSTRL